LQAGQKHGDGSPGQPKAKGAASPPGRPEQPLSDLFMK
jgi:hypothetical protein